MLRRFWHPVVGFFLVLWLLLLYGGQTRFFQDPGTFWHIVVGERILASGQLMRADEFTYTRRGTPWTPFQWLGECGMALLHRAGGFDLVLLAGVTLLVALYAWLAWRLLRVGLHWLWTAVVVALVVGVSTPHFHLRPHLPTIVFTGWTFALLTAFEAGRLRLAGLALLLPLFVLWTNLHGGVLGGYAMVGLMVAGWCLTWLVGLASPVRSWTEAACVLLLAALCPLTALVNPYGVEVPRTWVWIMQSKVVPEMVLEHASLTLTSGTGLLALLLAGGYLTILVSTWPRGPRLTWLLPLVWAWLSWSRGRHAPLFAITAGLALAEMLPLSRLAGRLLEPLPTEEEPRRFPWPALLLPVGLVLVAVGLQVGKVRVPLVGAGWGGPDPNDWPVELVSELHQRGEDRPRIFNEYSLGGFLIYYTPEIPVFIDDRCEVMGEEFLEEYRRALQVPGEAVATPAVVEAWEREWGFTLALVWRDSPFDRYFAHQGWQEVGQTRGARLYRRPS